MTKHRGKPPPVRAPRRKFVDRDIVIGDRIILAAGRCAGMLGIVIAIETAVLRAPSNEKLPGPRHLIVDLDVGGRVAALPDDARFNPNGVGPRRPPLPPQP